jgi:hypothetical protein
MPTSSLRTSMVLTAALVVLFGVSLQTARAAGAPRPVAKPAWEWSVDERLAKRFDPEAIQARKAQHAAEIESSDRKFRSLGGGLWKSEFETPKGQVVDTVEGTKNPELFLTWELFDHLLDMAFSGDEEQGRWREGIEEKAAALGIGRDLWSRLGKAAAPYLEIRRREERKAMSGGSAQPEVEGFEMNGPAIRWCRARARAIAAARTDFGALAFNRLLYEGVTPGFGVTYVVRPGLAVHLRRLEEGCR